MSNSWLFHSVFTVFLSHERVLWLICMVKIGQVLYHRSADCLRRSEAAHQWSTLQQLRSQGGTPNFFSAPTSATRSTHWEIATSLHSDVCVPYLYKKHIKLIAICRLVWVPRLPIEILTFRWAWSTASWITQYSPTHASKAVLGDRIRQWQEPLLCRFGGQSLEGTANTWLFAFQIVVSRCSRSFKTFQGCTASVHGFGRICWPLHISHPGTGAKLVVARMTMPFGCNLKTSEDIWEDDGWC